MWLWLISSFLFSSYPIPPLIGKTKLIKMMFYLSSQGYFLVTKGFVSSFRTKVEKKTPLIFAQVFITTTWISLNKTVEQGFVFHTQPSHSTVRHHHSLIDMIVHLFTSHFSSIFQTDHLIPLLVGIITVIQFHLYFNKSNWKSVVNLNFIYPETNLCNYI